MNFNKVRLVNYSQPPPEEHGGSLKEQLAYMARVSNPKSQEAGKNPWKLIEFLIKEGHWSPLEMVSVALEIETPRDIARQILRHRSFSFQEFSQRYADPTEALGFVSREARLQDSKNRQNSLENEDEDLKDWWAEQQSTVTVAALSAYRYAITAGIAKEQARVVLPEGLTMSRMYMHGTLRSWYHYCAQRKREDTQKEHRDVAEKAWVIIEDLIEKH